MIRFHRTISAIAAGVFGFGTNSCMYNYTPLFIWMFLRINASGLPGLKLFIQQNTHKNTEEIASYIEQVFIL